jgi:subtilisin family serine protease
LAAPRDSADPALLAQTLHQHAAISRRQVAQLGVSVLDVPERYSAAILESLRRTGLFRYVERDYYARTGGPPNDPKYPAQWHLQHIHTPEAWSTTTGAPGILVAVIDSGVDALHPDLAAQLVPGWNFLTGTSDTGDQVGHGTAVAGTLAALSDNGIGVAGVSWHSQILPVAVVDMYEQAAYSDIAAAIQYAADRGARIINVSIGGQAQSSTLQAAVDYASARGALIFASAMNNASSTPYYPAACDGVVAVAATDATDHRASFSNFGDWITLTAPGVDILTTSMGGGYGYWSGTSFASPIAAGVAALVLAVKPSATNAELRQLLVNTSDGNLVNAAKAVQAAGQRAPAGQ